jgi:hypothetical protein
MATAWNLFVRKIYREGKAKNPNYEFKQALVDASKRKGEMKHMSTTTAVSTRGKRKGKGKTKSKTRRQR